MAPGAATHDMVIGAEDAAPLVVSCVAPGAATHDMVIGAEDAAPLVVSCVAPGAATHDMVIGADDAAPLVASCAAPGAATIIARHDVPGEDSNSTRKAGSLHGVIEAQTDIFGSYSKTKSKPFTVSSSTPNEPGSQTRKRRARLNARRRFAARCRQMFTVSQSNNTWNGGARVLSSSNFVPSSDRGLSTDKNWPESCMFTASLFILALHALVGQFIHSVYRERCGGGPRDTEARSGARGGEVRCGPRDIGARVGPRGGEARGGSQGGGAHGGARGGEARCGPRDSGARGGIRGGGAQGFQDSEACFGNKSSGGDALGVPRGSICLSF